MNDVGVNDMISIQKRVQFKASIMSKIVGAKTGFNQQRTGGKIKQNLFEIKERKQKL